MVYLDDEAERISALMGFEAASLVYAPVPLRDDLCWLMVRLAADAAVSIRLVSIRHIADPGRSTLAGGLGVCLISEPYGSTGRIKRFKQMVTTIMKHDTPKSPRGYQDNGVHHQHWAI